MLLYTSQIIRLSRFQYDRVVKTQSTDRYYGMLQEYAFNCRIAFKASKKKNSTRRPCNGNFISLSWCGQAKDKKYNNNLT